LINQQQKPLEAKSRPLPYHMKDKVRQKLREQEDAGLIRRSNSEWTSPVRVVHKPDVGKRITVDYKPLKSFNFPLPNIEDIYNHQTKSEFFSKIDLKSAYFQIPSDDKIIKYTAFVCEFGIFEYVVMPMGIKTAPAFYNDLWFKHFKILSIEKYYKYT
jgi:hypothetical protein